MCIFICAIHRVYVSLELRNWLTQEITITEKHYLNNQFIIALKIKFEISRFNNY